MMRQSMTGCAGRCVARGRRAVVEAVEARRLLSTVTVTTLSDVTNASDGLTTLREAIASAAAGDTINVQSGLSGTIILTQGQLTLTKHVAILGPGASALAISGNSASRIFWVNGGVSAKITKLTLTSGKGTGYYSAGAVRNTGELAMYDCVVTANTSGVTGQSVYGGAVDNSGTMSMTNCTVSNNALRAPTGSKAGGGGIDNTGTMSLSNCVVEGNTARGSTGRNGIGGGILNFMGSLVLTNCKVQNNTASGGTAANASSGSSIGGVGLGGGLYVEGGKLTINGGSFSGNKALGGAGYNNAIGSSSGAEAIGGGLYIAGQVAGPTITNCTFALNQAIGGAGASGAANHGFGGQAMGGGAYVLPATSFSGCGFAQNSAVGGQGGRRTGLTILTFQTGGQASGGAIYGDGALTVSGSSFTSNVATGGGGSAAGLAYGGAISSPRTLNVSVSSFVSNRATGGAGLSTGGIGAAGSGGAIYATAGGGNVARCLFQWNWATGGKGGSALSAPTASKAAGSGGLGMGGAVTIGGGITVANCTLTGNIARGGAGGDGVNTTTAKGGAGERGFGGGVYGLTDNASKVLACTIVSNEAWGGLDGLNYVPDSNTNDGGIGGGVIGNKISMGNTIVAKNLDDVYSSNDVHQSVISLGYNLIGVKHLTSTWLASDITGTVSAPKDPKLNGLADNGGGTKTMSLISGSPAIDKGKAFGLTVDQRNVKRPVDQSAVANASGGDGSDIGAYEVQATSTTQTPYKGTPFAVGNTPITIQAEDFDNGGEGVAYHDVDTTNSGGAYRTGGVDIQACNDQGGGYSIGWTRAGEWLEYTVNVATAQNYTFDFRIASSAAGGTFRILVDGVDKSGAITAPSTGGWQTWTTISKQYVALPAGQHVVRISMETIGASGGVANFNFMRISPTGGG